MNILLNAMSVRFESWKSRPVASYWGHGDSATSSYMPARSLPHIPVLAASFLAAFALSLS